MKAKFILSAGFGGLWLAISTYYAIGWAGELTQIFSAVYVWWVIVGIALLPGFLMSMMFFSNLLHQKLRQYPQVFQDMTVILCAHNEEKTIGGAIRAILNQEYPGCIRLIVVDNASTDHTREEIEKYQGHCRKDRWVQYVYCAHPGKAYALNMGLEMVTTPYFLTVDADTFLEKYAVQRIMDHIVSRKSACVAGNLYVENTKASLAARMQNYDYLLSIAATKRFQGSYQSTLVAQGAFSAYDTDAVRRVGGWQDVLGEDIVLTYQLLSLGLASTYEPRAVGYTIVPVTLEQLYNQRKRWAIGMLEGLTAVPPWKQATAYSRYFTSVNLSVIYLDLAYLFGFIPGVILALFGYCFFVGVLTLITVAICIVLFWSMYRYQKKLGIPFQNSICGFVFFLLFFQAIQSTAAVHGYLIFLLHRGKQWK